MALADPQSVTISGTAISLPRVSSSGETSTYTSADGNTSLRISHSGKTTKRVAITLLTRKVSPDPFVSTVNRQLQETWTISNVAPEGGFTVAELKAAWDGFSTLVNGSSAALISRALSGES